MEIIIIIIIIIIKLCLLKLIIGSSERNVHCLTLSVTVVAALNSNPKFQL